MSLTGLMIMLAVTFGGAGGSAGAAAGEPGAMVLGNETRFSDSLLGGLSDEFYGLQLTPRGDRICHVKAFFRGAPPQSAHFCRGRVTAWHMRNSTVAATGLGERLTGLGVCFDDREIVRGVRLHASSGDTLMADFGECTTAYESVHCRDGWFVQGVQLFFDGLDSGRFHRRLVGVRPLCSVLTGVPPQRSDID
jgi:hypothetical protein